MIVSRRSILTYNVADMDIPITPEQLAAVKMRTRPIQEIVPDLSAEHREFLMTGITPEEWANAFGPEEADEEEADGQPDEAQEWRDFDPEC